MWWKILNIIAGIGIFGIMAVVVIVLYLMRKHKDEQLRNKMDEEDAWMESLDDSEWYTSEDG